jgi:hypothetical protein
MGGQRSVSVKAAAAASEVRHPPSANGSLAKATPCETSKAKAPRERSDCKTLSKAASRKATPRTQSDANGTGKAARESTDAKAASRKATPRAPSDATALGKAATRSFSRSISRSFSRTFSRSKPSAPATTKSKRAPSGCVHGGSSFESAAEAGRAADKANEAPHAHGGASSVGSAATPPTIRRERWTTPIGMALESDSRASTLASHWHEPLSRGTAAGEAQGERTRTSASTCTDTYMYDDTPTAAPPTGSFKHNEMLDLLNAGEARLQTQAALPTSSNGGGAGHEGDGGEALDHVGGERTSSGCRAVSTWTTISTCVSSVNQEQTPLAASAAQRVGGASPTFSSTPRTLSRAIAAADALRTLSMDADSWTL